MDAPKNRIPWNKGLTKETSPIVAEIARKQMGTPTPSRKGSKPWWEVKGVPNPATQMETKKKISEKAKGRTLWWIKRGEPNPSFNPEVREKISKQAMGRKPWNKGIPRTKEEKEKMSRGHQARYLAGAPRLAPLKRTPSAPEKHFATICAKYQLPYKYVGDGKFWVGGVNPDFVSVEDKRIAVDIFGDYHHSPLFAYHSIRKAAQYDERIRIFRKFGWKLIIIWDSEVKDERLVLKRLGVEEAKLAEDMKGIQEIAEMSESNG